MMQKVQNESLLLSFFMAVLLFFTSCETGGSNRESIEEGNSYEMIEGEDVPPAEDDSINYEDLDSANNMNEN